MQGWIKLHRQVMESAVWNCLTAEQFRVFITCLLMANHEPKKWYWGGKPVTIKKGQFISSYGHIAEKAMVGTQSVRSAIKKLVDLEVIVSTPTSQGTMLTVCNWDTYQKKEQQPNTPSIQPPTDPQQGANRPPTDPQQQLKNVKNEKNEEESRGVAPPPEPEFKPYIIKPDDPIEYLKFHRQEWEALIKQFGHYSKFNKSLTKWGYWYTANQKKMNPPVAVFASFKSWITGDIEKSSNSSTGTTAPTTRKIHQ